MGATATAALAVAPNDQVWMKTNAGLSTLAANGTIAQTFTTSTSSPGASAQTIWIKGAMMRVSAQGVAQVPIVLPNQIPSDYGAAVDAAGNFAYVSSLPVNGSADGLYSFAFTARDRAGNASIPIASMYALDTQGPAVTFTSPAQGVLTATNPTIIGQANDAGGSGVASVQWRLDSGAYATVGVGAGGQFQITPSLATNAWQSQAAS